MSILLECRETRGFHWILEIHALYFLFFFLFAVFRFAFFNGNAFALAHVRGLTVLIVADSLSHSGAGRFFAVGLTLAPFGPNAPHVFGARGARLTAVHASPNTEWLLKNVACARGEGNFIYSTTTFCSH